MTSLPDPSNSAAGRRILWSGWFDRFQVIDPGGGELLCRDWLRPGGRRVPREAWLSGGGVAPTPGFFCSAFVPAAESSMPRPVRDRPAFDGDLLFWQFPCRTEGAAFDLHHTLRHAHFDGRQAHVYVGLPWATWIDKERVDSEQAAALVEIRRLSTRLRGVRHLLESLGVSLRVHTVCQHIYWPTLLHVWQRLGVTDLWLAHCPPQGQDYPTRTAGLRLHPWRLFAVNVEDPDRRAGLAMDRDPATKPLLASFVGAHADHYLSDIRLRLLALAEEDGFRVEVGHRWHFEDVVYRHQIVNEAIAQDPASDATVHRYNRVLSDSRFSLCPAGAGPNTLRLWESLAAGAVPVLLGQEPRLPDEGELADIDWDAIVVRWVNAPLADLPSFLRRMPLDEVRQRQNRGLEAFRRVQSQRCF